MAIVGALPVTLQNGTIADATQVMADLNSIKNDVNANAAKNGANSDITSLAGLSTPLSTTQGGTGSATPANFSAGGYRNIARRNGGLEIWQRGAGGAASIAVGASTTAYTADGWYLNTGANEASVVSQQAGLTSGSQWCAKVQKNSGQTGTGAMVFGFPLDTDEIYPVLGQFLRLSFTAKAGANYSPASSLLNVILATGTGAPVKLIVGYTGRSDLINVNQAITTSAVRYQFNTSVIVPTTTRQMEIAFAMTPVGTAGVDDSFYIDDVQLEIVPAATGYTASNFERLTFEEQQALCLRHFFKTFLYATAPAQNVGINTGEFQATASVAGAVPTYFHCRWPVQMRISPTLTLFNPANTNGLPRNITDSVDAGSATLANASQNSQRINAVGTAGSAADAVWAVHVTADAGI